MGGLGGPAAVGEACGMRAARGGAFLLQLPRWRRLPAIQTAAPAPLPPAGCKVSSPCPLPLLLSLPLWQPACPCLLLPPPPLLTLLSLEGGGHSPTPPNNCTPSPPHTHTLVTGPCKQRAASTTPSPPSPPLPSTHTHTHAEHTGPMAAPATMPPPLASFCSPPPSNGDRPEMEGAEAPVCSGPPPPRLSDPRSSPPAAAPPALSLRE